MVLVSGGSSAEVPSLKEPWIVAVFFRSLDRKKGGEGVPVHECCKVWGHGAQRMKCFMWDTKMYSNLEPRVCVERSLVSSSRVEFPPHFVHLPSDSL